MSDNAHANPTAGKEMGMALMTPQRRRKREMLEICLWMSGHFSIAKRRDTDFPLEEFRERLSKLFELGEYQGRVNELERIQASTLDADDDVWSTTDDGQLVPLTARLADLRAV